MLSFKGVFASVLLLFSLAGGTSQNKEVPPQEPPYRHQQFLDFLVQCESTGNPNAVNPKDLDGTPSYGLLQFKKGTLYNYLLKYKILPDIERQEVMNVIFDGDLQIRIFKKMMEDPSVNLSAEFPACLSKFLTSGRIP